MSAPQYLSWESPIGRIAIVADAAAVVQLHIYSEDGTREFSVDPSWVERPQAPVLARARAELEEYFAGTRRVFSVPLRPAGTAYQREVWAALQKIAYGQTTSYGAIAAALSRPSAARAVGGAVGKNPLAIFIPCHRVIAKGGALTGFAHGLRAKRALLEIEGHAPGLAHQRALPLHAAGGLFLRGRRGLRSDPRAA